MSHYFAQRIFLFIPVVLALTVHEWAHARAALALGDDTAYRLGRLTLNPLAHIDPVGTVLLPLLGIPFGWAKPVPVNPSRFRPEVTMGQGMMITAVAGPASNLAMALIGALAIRVADSTNASLPDGVQYLLEMSVNINLALSIFNLLPIPPLDGSRVVDGLIPFEWRGTWDGFTRISGVVLIVVLVAPQFLGFGLGNWVAGLASVLKGH